MAGAAFEAEPPQPRQRQHGGVEFARIHLRHPRLNVPTDRAHLQIGPHLAHLGLAPGRAGPHHRATRQAVQSAGPPAHQRIARVLAQRHRRDDQPLRPLRRQVLIAVDGHVDLARGERLLDRGREPARAFARGERCRLVAVPGCRDRDDFDGEPRMRRPQPVGDELRLREGQFAAPRTDPERAHLRATSRSASCAATTVASISASVCAAETNQVSNCEGGNSTPRSSIAPWKCANAAVLEARAPA